MDSLNLKPIEYEMDLHRAVTIKLSIGIPPLWRRYWYIFGGVKKGFGDTPDYWRNGEWVCDTPQQFATAEDAFKAYRASFAPTEQP